MDLHFNVGDRFYINNGLEDMLLEIVNIDYEDHEFPYECYPVETIEKTKEIYDNAILIDEDDELYEFKDNDGEVYEFYKGLGLRYIINDFFVDERWCCSDYDILEYKYKQAQKEIEALKIKTGLVNEINSSVDYDLLNKIEKDEQGFVADNINDMFEYMFNEGYTFDEFVNMLTPEIKEAIVFAQKWFGGVVAEVKYKDCLFSLEARGDINCTLFDKNENELGYVKDRNNSGRFCAEMAHCLANDAELHKAKKDGLLVFENNNWFEVFIMNSNKEWQTMTWLSSTDDIEECIFEMIETLDEMIEEIDKNKQVKCLNDIVADKNTEDYTHEFSVNIYEPETKKSIDELIGNATERSTENCSVISEKNDIVKE